MQSSYALSRFEETKIMKFENINKYLIGRFLYKYMYVKHQLPIAFKDFLTRVEDALYLRVSNKGGRWVDAATCQYELPPIWFGLQSMSGMNEYELKSSASVYSILEGKCENN